MLAPGSTFDRYTIEALLGQGGWGHVFCAVDTRLRRRVALKVLRQERASDGLRLLQEARAAASLQHPNVVSIFDMGEWEGTPYIAMELVEGVPLSRVAQDPSVAVPQRLAWLTDVAKALAAAHRAGVLHRDVKPQNVMVARTGAIKVLDFGLAKPVQGPASQVAGGPKTQWGFQTRQGYVVGTPRYMAPEALFGEACDGRADQYSWGVLAYEMLSGQHPRGGDAGAVAAAGTVPPLLSELVPTVPFPVGVVVSKALSYRREDRYADMGAVLGALEGTVEGARAAATPPPEYAPRANTLGDTIVGAHEPDDMRGAATQGPGGLVAALSPPSMPATVGPTRRGGPTDATQITTAPWMRPAPATPGAGGPRGAEPPSILAPPQAAPVHAPAPVGPQATMASPAYQGATRPAPRPTQATEVSLVAAPAGTARWGTAESPAYGAAREPFPTQVSAGVPPPSARAASASKVASQVRTIRVLLAALGAVVVLALVATAYFLGESKRGASTDARLTPPTPRGGPGSAANPSPQTPLPAAGSDHAPLPAACEHFLSRLTSCGNTPATRASFANAAKQLRDSWSKYPPAGPFCASREATLDPNPLCHSGPVREPVAPAASPPAKHDILDPFE